MITYYAGYEEGAPQDMEHLITVVKFDPDGEYACTRYDWRVKQFVWDEFTPKYMMHAAPMAPIGEEDVQNYISYIDNRGAAVHPEQ